MIYDSQGKYAGSILLCKALPLTDNLVRLLSLEKIFANEGYRYGMLCRNELDYLNSSLIHNKIQIKLQECIYGQHSSSKPLRVDYSLIIKNVAIYNAYKLEQATQKIEILKSEIEDIRNSSLKNNEKRK
ncbi:hypothetical protein FACS1894166_02350 [Bacilli bacterium]|nr:hypothetical protein FACS1894166_02350 [Bacilli bacterium]